MANRIGRALQQFRARLGYTGSPSFWNQPPNLKGYSANVTPETAYTVATAYACIRAISSTLAYLPKGIYQQTDQGKSAANAHPVHKLIAQRPNSYQTAFEFWERMYCSALTHGRGVAIIERDNFSGYAAELHHVHPKSLKFLNVEGRPIIEVDGTAYNYADVFIVSEMGGRSPIELHSDNLNLAKDVEAYGSEFFEGGHLLGVLSADGPLTNDQLRDLQRAWNSTEKRGVKMLPQGMRYQPISLPPEQTQFLTTRRYQDETICTIFGVPPQVVGVATNETKSNSEEQGRNFVRMTLTPRAVQTEQEIARKLLPEIEQANHFAAFEFNELQRGDMAARGNYLSTLLRDGVISRNEARDMEGMNKRSEPGADALLVQVNQITVDQVESYSQKIASNAVE